MQTFEIIIEHEWRELTLLLPFEIHNLFILSSSIVRDLTFSKLCLIAYFRRVLSEAETQ